MRLRPLPVERVEAYLKDLNADESTAHLLAHISGGRPGYALRLMQNEDAVKFRTDRLNEMQALLTSTRRARFAYAEKLTSRKKKEAAANEAGMDEGFHETLLLWLSFWRDVLLRVSGSDAPLANVDYAEAVDAMAARLSLAGIWKLVNDAEGAIEKLENNINPRLLAELTLLDWPKT
jgi:DNA polymerase-3 subunit delta'